MYLRILKLNKGTFSGDKLFFSIKIKVNYTILYLYNYTLMTDYWPA